MLVIVRQAPPSSALVRKMLGEDHIWGLPEQLLATTVDVLRVANWQRAGGKEKDRPQPIPRPGVEKSKRHGGDAVSIEEMRERLEKRRHLSVVTEDQPRR